MRISDWSSDVCSSDLIDRLAAMFERALGQQVALEHRIDRLQIKFGRHVADRAIFVVEFLGLVRALAVAVDQMYEHLPMAHHVIAQVHRHEAGELQKARIYAAPGAGIPRSEAGREGKEGVSQDKSRWEPKHY